MKTVNEVVELVKKSHPRARVKGQLVACALAKEGYWTASDVRTKFRKAYDRGILDYISQKYPEHYHKAGYGGSYGRAIYVSPEALEKALKD